MTLLRGHNFQENHRIREIHLSERIAAAQTTADHTMKAVAAHAAHTFPEMQAEAGSAVKAAVAHAPPVRDAVMLGKEAAAQTMRVVRHAAAPAAEAMSTCEGWEKIGGVALHVADHIIDEASRPYTGGVPVYRYVKEAIVAVNESISETRKKKADQC